MQNPSRGLLLDLDGTIYVGPQPIPGAIEALDHLRQARIPLRFVTNTTRCPASALVEQLAGLGLEVTEVEILTAPKAAVRWLLERGLRRVHPLLLEATWKDLASLELVDEDADVVLVGDLADQWSRARLDRAFRLLLAGARLVAVQKGRYSAGPDGMELDAGAFVAALEYAAGVEAAVVGKPNPAFFRAAAEDLGVPIAAVAMVGDDLAGDVGGAQRAGARGVLVRTGKYRPEDERDPDLRPDAILDSVADLPAWMGL